MKKKILFLLALAGTGFSQPLPSPDETGVVAVKVVPATSVIEAEVAGPAETVWEKAFRQNARYVAAADLSLWYPLIVVYPDWDTTPGQMQQRLLVQSILSPPSRFPEPREKGLRIVETPALTVAAYAYRGPYTLDRFQTALAAIHAHLKAKNIPAVGPPRHLYYSNVDWSLKWWRLSEVQVPIPNQSRPD
jgi:hypothetical protein